MKDSIIEYSYNDSNISFDTKNGKVMVNATEMAKPFGKQPVFWINNQSTKDFLEELSKLRNLSLADLVVVTKGGNNPGTWMHEDIALEFARWLSPAFAIWCNDKIKELLQTGVTTVKDEDEAIAYAMNVLTKRLNKAKAEKAALEKTNQAQRKQIEVMSGEIVEMKKKTDYLDRILASKGTVTVTQIAQDYGMSAKAFNKTLADIGIQRKVNGQWILFAKYMANGYVHSKSVSIVHSDGRPDTVLNTEWTQRGRLFLYEALKAGGILPVIERAA